MNHGSQATCMAHRLMNVFCSAWSTVVPNLSDGTCTLTFKTITAIYLCSIATFTRIISWQQKNLMFTYVATSNHGTYWGMHAAQSNHTNLHRHGFGVVANIFARISQGCRLETYTNIMMSHFSFYSCPPWQDHDACLASKVARITIKKSFHNFQSL